MFSLLLPIIIYLDLDKMITRMVSWWYMQVRQRVDYGRLLPINVEEDTQEAKIDGALWLWTLTSGLVAAPPWRSLLLTSMLLLHPMEVACVAINTAIECAVSIGLVMMVPMTDADESVWLGMQAFFWALAVSSVVEFGAWLVQERPRPYVPK